MNQPAANPFPAVFMLLGAVVLIAVIWKIYHPAAVITAGLVLLVFGFFGRASFGGGE